MKSIFKKNDYQIMVNTGERKACIVKGSNKVFVALEELTPLSPVAAKHLKMMGCDPKLYLNIGHSNHVVLKEAEGAWREALLRAEKNRPVSSTSMIQMFWHNLPGLIELREAEDTYAACQRSASLMLEHRQRGLPPTRLVDLRQKYPRSAAYILSEAYAFSGSESLALLGRKAMKMLVSGDPVEDALSVLPEFPPDPTSSEYRREAGEQW